MFSKTAKMFSIENKNKELENRRKLGRAACLQTMVYLEECRSSGAYEAPELLVISYIEGWQPSLFAKTIKMFSIENKDRKSENHYSYSF